MKKTLKNIQNTSKVTPLEAAKSTNFRGGTRYIPPPNMRYIPPPKPMTKPGNNY